MNLYLLDAGGVLIIGYFLVIFHGLTVFLEWGVLILFKINRPGKLLLFSFIVNLVSLGLGYVMLPVIKGIGVDTSSLSIILKWVAMFSVTVLAEGLLLILLNKQNSVSRNKIWLAALVMNTVTYLVLYFWFI